MKDINNQHVLPHEGKWAVKGANNERVTKIFDTQAEAVDYGRQIAKNEKVELIIHGEDGAIRARDSYGHDPKNIPG